MLDAPHIFLDDKFTYYQQLSPKGKRKFLARTKHVAFKKEFVGRDGLRVTDEMRLLISACWVQVTYGLDFYLTEEYAQVHIYPQTFFSNLADHEVKGLTTGEGIIFISWLDFVEDYKVANNLNVGMHEITHAMLISAAFKHNFDDYFTEHYKDFFDNTKEVFWDLRNGYQSYLREYGGTNFVEFLSVSVEAFFENPRELKTSLPELYYNLCALLKQDPLNTIGDYKVSRNLVNEMMYTRMDHGIPAEVLEQLESNSDVDIKKIKYFFYTLASLVGSILLIRTAWLFTMVGIVVFSIYLQKLIKLMREG